jgi:hypothetical protein
VLEEAAREALSAEFEDLDISFSEITRRSGFLPMLHAARQTGMQVNWDLLHWGWPDDLDIWSPAFVTRFGNRFPSMYR